MRNVWLVLTVLALGAPSAAQEPERPDDRLELIEVVESALRTHPAIGAAVARAGAAEAESGRARAARLPWLAATATATRHEEPMVVAPLHGFDPTNPPAFDRTLYQGHATADYILFDGGARGARIRAADRRADVAEAGVVAARDAVVTEAVSSYLAVLTAEEVRAAHAQRVAALETERSRSTLLFSEGKSPRVAVLRTEAALSRATAEREVADEQWDLAVRRLARVSGLPPSRVGAARLAPFAAVPERVPDRDALLAAARASNSRLIQAERRVAAAEAAVSGARSSYLPRLALAGRYSAFGAADADLRPEWNAGVQVSYPIFTGGERVRAVEQARAEAAVAAEEARLVERDVGEIVDQGLVAYRSARARVEALEAAVTQSEEVARIEALALEAGAGMQTEYLRAEADLLEARAALAEARHAVLEARVRLAQATGELSVDWLERIGEVER